MLKFYLDNKEIGSPKNWKELNIVVNFDNVNASLSTSEFEFHAEEAKKINAYYEAGLTGGAGIFEGQPFRVDLICATGVFTILNGYLELTTSEFKCDIVKARAKESGKVDFFNEIAPSFGFAYLKEINLLTDNYYKPVKYQRESVPNGVEVAIISVSIYALTKEIAELAERIANLVGEITGGATGIAGAIIEAVALTIYLGLVILALVALIKALIENLIPFTREHLGMLVKDKFELACQYLGYQFNSSIIDSNSNLLILPPKQAKGKKVTVIDVNGSNKAGVGYWDVTFAEFLTAMQTTFNAKVKILGNQLYFENENYFINQANWVIPDVKKLYFKTNAEEISSNYIIKYQIDYADLQTLNNDDFFEGNGYLGTSIQVVLKPEIIINNKNILLKNLEYKNIPFAHAKAKEKLNLLDKVFDKLLTAFRGIGNVWNKILSPLPSKVRSKLKIKTENLDFINDSIGYVLLEKDFITTPRLMLYDESKKRIASNSRQVLKAESLYDNYHYTNSALPNQSNANGNQWIIYENITIPFCCEDYLKLINNNYCKTIEGYVAKITKLSWNPFNNTANIDYRVNKRYTTNLIEKRIIDGVI